MLDNLHVDKDATFYIPLTGALKVPGKKPYKAGSIMNIDVIKRRLSITKKKSDPLSITLDDNCSQSFLLEVPIEKYVAICKLWKASNKEGNPF